MKQNRRFFEAAYFEGACDYQDINNHSRMYLLNSFSQSFYRQVFCGTTDLTLNRPLFTVLIGTQGDIPVEVFTIFTEYSKLFETKEPL